MTHKIPIQVNLKIKIEKFIIKKNKIKRNNKSIPQKNNKTSNLIKEKFRMPQFSQLKITRKSKKNREFQVKKNQKPHLNQNQLKKRR